MPVFLRPKKTLFNAFSEPDHALPGAVTAVARQGDEPASRVCHVS